MNNDYYLEKIPYQMVLSSKEKLLRRYPEDDAELYVRDVPPNTSVFELFDFFKTAGRIYEVRLMMNADYNSNRQFAYVGYFSRKVAVSAISELKDVPFGPDEKCLEIRKSFNNRRIFLGNILTTKSKDEVWKELDKMGNKNITDVIMYRSYANRAENRGFVFVEFKTHEQAARFRAKNANMLQLFGRDTVVDWSIPYPEPNEDDMLKVKKIFIRNLNVVQTNEEIKSLVTNYVSSDVIEKVYKFKDYAFVHCTTREIANFLFEKLTDFYKNTLVEISWAKPGNEFTTPEFRHHRVNLNEKMKLSKLSGSIRRSPASSEASSEASSSQYGTSPVDNPLADHVAFYRYLYSQRDLNSSFYSENEPIPQSFSPELEKPSFSQVARGASVERRIPFQELSLNNDLPTKNTPKKPLNIETDNVCRQLFGDNKENELANLFKTLNPNQPLNFEDSRFNKYYQKKN